MAQTLPELLPIVVLWSCMLPSGAGGGGICPTNITFKLKPRQESELLSITSYSAGDLAPYYSLPRQFIDSVRPGPLPYGLVRDVACTLRDCEDAGNSSALDGEGIELITEVYDRVDFWLLPVLVVVGLGLLLTLLFPICGLFLCCCRLCGLCGAKAHQHRSKHQTPKCIVFTVIVIAANAMIVAGVVLGFVSNDKISKSIGSIEGVATAALEDGSNYLIATTDEVISIVDEFSTLSDAVSCRISKVDRLLGEPLQEALLEEANPLFQEIEDVLIRVGSIRSELEVINQTVGELVELTTDLNMSLSQISCDVMNLSVVCATAMCSPSLCGNISFANSISTVVDWTQVQDLTSAFATLDAIDISEIEGLIESANGSIYNITSVLTEEVEELDIDSIIADAQSELSDITEEIQSAVDNATSTDGVLEEARDTLTDILGEDGYVGQYETYRYGVAAFFLFLIVLIAVVFTVGIFCGVFGYSPKDLPSERNSVAHCGAKVLFIAMALSFVTAGFFLAMTTLIYFLSTTAQKICDDLEPPGYVIFVEVADDPSLWGGYTLVGSIADDMDVSLNLSLASFLNECEDGAALWQALQADSAIDLNSLLENVTELLEEFCDDDAINDPLSLSTDDIIPASSRRELEHLESNITKAVNFSEYEQLTSERILSFSVDGLVSELELLANETQMVCSAVGNESLRIIADLERVNSTLVQAMLNETNILEEAVEQLYNLTQGISSSVQCVLNTTDAFISGIPTIVEDETDIYLGILKDQVNDYINFVNDTVRYEVGMCSPVADIYKSVHIATCDDLLDGLNGFWFSIGWCVLFVVPAIVFSVLVTNYLRYSPSDIHHFTEDERESLRELPEMHINNHVAGYGGAQTYPTENCDDPHVPMSDW